MDKVLKRRQRFIADSKVCVWLYYVICCVMKIDLKFCGQSIVHDFCYLAVLVPFELTKVNMMRVKISVFLNGFWNLVILL